MAVDRKDVLNRVGKVLIATGTKMFTILEGMPIPVRVMALEAIDMNLDLPPEVLTHLLVHPAEVGETIRSVPMMRLLFDLAAAEYHAALTPNALRTLRSDMATIVAGDK